VLHALLGRTGSFLLRQLRGVMRVASIGARIPSSDRRKPVKQNRTTFATILCVFETAIDVEATRVRRPDQTSFRARRRRLLGPDLVVMRRAEATPGRRRLAKYRARVMWTSGARVTAAGMRLPACTETVLKNSSFRASNASSSEQIRPSQHGWSGD
jgi:hypothetical protein